MSTRIGGGRLSLMSTKHRFEFDPHISIKEEWVTKGEITSIVERPEHPILDAFSLALQKKIKFNPHIPDTSEMLSDFFQTKVTNEDAHKYVISYVKAYISFKKTKRLVDFDDVLDRVTNFKIVKDEKFPELDVLIIDEAQDLSNLQWDFVERLIQKSNKVYLSGDDDQAIMETFGAAPNRFTSFKTNVEDVALKNSHRVPECIKEYVDTGVMKDIEKLTDRVPKTWKSSDTLKDGQVYYSQNRPLNDINDKQDNNDLTKKKPVLWGMNKDYTKDSDLYIEDITPNHLLEIVLSKQNEDWLILCPTNATAEKLSAGMKNHHKIPHFYKNKPVLNAQKDYDNINIRTIHTSKGLGADNVAIVCISVGDITMLGDHNPKLAYVALTRAKSNLYPRVLATGLITEASKYFHVELQNFLFRFPKPKQRKLEDDNKLTKEVQDGEDPEIPF